MRVNNFTVPFVLTLESMDIYYDYMELIVFKITLKHIHNTYYKNVIKQKIRINRKGLFII